MSRGAIDAEQAFRLYGTTRAETPPRRLRAGRLVADFKDGNLRTITYDGIEVLRAISFLVRDRDWGTYSPVIGDLTIEESAASFLVGYSALCEGPDGSELRIEATIEAAASGVLTFEAKAVTGTGFETNRCGFCILHPIVDLAGAPVSVEHVDGTIEQTRLPDLIAPWQPFKQMRAITHSVTAGVTAECRMEGDAFEMEDQRNWSDASYKTYVRPLELPWPYRIEAGEPVRQRIALTVRDTRAAATRPAEPVNGGAISLSPGTESGIVPAIGLVIAPEQARDRKHVIDVVSDTGVQELLFHFDPAAGHGASALSDFAAIADAHRGTTTLEIALPCRDAPRDELAEMACLMRNAGLALDAVVVSPSVDRQSTPPGSAWPACPPLGDIYRAARIAFPGMLLGGGMLSYFTELNRKRVPADELDFITHCTNPIVHAADDLSVMQTLEALPFITKSVRAIYGDKPYRIGPSTIAMRQNPYGSRTMDNGAGDRIPMAHQDPRHNGDFAAAFAMGYVARVLPAGLDRLILSAAIGPFGLIAGNGEPVPDGKRRPIGSVIRSLAGLSGRSWNACVSSAPDRVMAFLIPAQDAPANLWIANLTSTVQVVDCDAITGAQQAQLHVADCVTGQTDEATGPVSLQPFSVNRLSLG